LGLKILSKGFVTRFKDNFNQPIWALWGRISGLGLGCYPQAFTKAINTFIIPAALFGVSIWGAKSLLNMMTSGASPYTHPAMSDIIKTIKQIYGLPARTFNAPLFKLLNIKSFVSLVLP
jgi:hypothetical protein